MISVCMATHNGERYLTEQIASILPQLADSDELVISDDASTDGTVPLLNGLKDPRIRLFTGNSFGSPRANFSFALQLCRGRLIAIADQDDVWLPGRIASLTGKMQGMEMKSSAAAPLLVHSDVNVVDEQLRPLAHSLWQYQNSDPIAGGVLNRLLVQNPVTGCSVMINSVLRDLALPIPPEAVMHDWWLALVASAFGKIGIISTPTVLYRQHERNDTGARRWSLRYALGQVKEQRSVMNRLYRQGEVFLEIYRDRLDPSQVELLEAFATIEQAGVLERRHRILKYRFFYAGLIRNVGRLILG